MAAAGYCGCAPASTCLRIYYYYYYYHYLLPHALGSTTTTTTTTTTTCFHMPSDRLLTKHSACSVRVRARLRGRGRPRLRLRARVGVRVRVRVRVRVSACSALSARTSEHGTRTSARQLSQNLFLKCSLPG
eukprot:scaffold51762_cov45-Phaeocystis_antarctica.AAC.3